ncbi:hypothetical protein EPUS_05272 [Endocarpon pusillum Z07020]|uniref:Uncharacterized protein n=1 Tax=Endocarpon pusillum (strain Z07020 / HMAS-L-300199) TaxID=1263415 RepID=U1G945_ENDPU|nr:uncharacterized protein EPUS_05272 [Endocarpon pusillum Z07020]ERF68191.1 hypothetical protein EPUS_05272 [Endocarpon pusillum Z07020]
MPHHPSEEEAESNIFDKVAQQSKDTSGASDHPIHKSEDQPGEESKDKEAHQETIQIHSSKGPQISDEMPEKASKEELRARAAELNK